MIEEETPETPEEIAEYEAMYKRHKEKRKMMECPVCGGKLITIPGYDYPNFCRGCDRLFWKPKSEDEWIRTW